MKRKGLLSVTTNLKRDRRALTRQKGQFVREREKTSSNLDKVKKHLFTGKTEEKRMKKKKRCGKGEVQFLSKQVKEGATKTKKKNHRLSIHPENPLRKRGTGK